MRAPQIPQRVRPCPGQLEDRNLNEELIALLMDRETTKTPILIRDAPDFLFSFTFYNGKIIYVIF